MEILQEVTEWDWPNHTYLLDNKGYLIAYVKEGQEELNRISRMSFSKTGRKFVKAENENLVEYGILYNVPILASPVAIPGKSWQVKGSGEKTYTVELIGDKYQCDCVGYGFRGRCKHSQQIKKENE